MSWECESEQRKESNPPIGWEIERKFLQILRFSDFPFAFLFHRQHSCLMDDLSWLKLELSTCRCGTGWMVGTHRGVGQPLSSEGSGAGGHLLAPSFLKRIKGTAL